MSCLQRSYKYYNNAVTCCEKCYDVSLQSQCKLKPDVKIVIMNESGQLRSTIDVPHALVKQKNPSIWLFQIPQKGYCYKTYKQIF